MVRRVPLRANANNPREARDFSQLARCEGDDSSMNRTSLDEPGAERLLDPLLYFDAMPSNLATYADLFALSADLRAEVIAGEVITSPSALPRHAKVQGALRAFIGGPYDDEYESGVPGGWWIFTGVDVALGAHDIVRPDLAGWRRERLPRSGLQRPIELAPDWVCEVLSPCTASRDRVIKRALYASAGIGHFWLIDPEARVLESFALGDRAWVDVGAYDEFATARVMPFDAVDLEVARLFLPHDADIE
jgi:Uma2 family endonuclease